MNEPWPIWSAFVLAGLILLAFLLVNVLFADTMEPLFSGAYGADLEVKAPPLKPIPPLPSAYHARAEATVTDKGFRIPVERAIELRSQGLTWRQVTEIIRRETGRRVHTVAIQTAVKRAKKRDVDASARP